MNSPELLDFEDRLNALELEMERLRWRPKDLLGRLVSPTVVTVMLWKVPELWNVQMITIWAVVMLGTAYILGQHVLKSRKLKRQRETLLEQADSRVPLLRARLDGHL